MMKGDKFMGWESMKKGVGAGRVLWGLEAHEWHWSEETDSEGKKDTPLSQEQREMCKIIDKHGGIKELRKSNWISICLPIKKDGKTTSTERNSETTK